MSSILRDPEVIHFVILRKSLIGVFIALWLAEFVFSWNMVSHQVGHTATSKMPDNIIDKKNTDQETIQKSYSVFSFLNLMVFVICAVQVYQQFKLLRWVNRIKKLERFGHDTRFLPRILVRYNKKVQVFTLFSGLIFLFTIVLTAGFSDTKKTSAES